MPLWQPRSVTRLNRQLVEIGGGRLQEQERDLFSPLSTIFVFNEALVSAGIYRCCVDSDARSIANVDSRLAVLE